MTAYFKVDITKLSHAEVWRWGSLLTFVAFAVRKALRWPSYGDVLVPASPGIIVLGPDEIRDDHRAALLPTLRVVLGSGFETAFYYAVATQGPSEGVAVATRHGSGCAFCLVTYAASGTVRDIGLCVVSRLEGGRFLATGSGGRKFDPPPEIDALSLPGRTPGEIIAAHMRRTEGAAISAIAADEVKPLILEVQRLSLDHCVRRGLYAPA